MINQHFCSEQLMATSFMTQAESCHNNEPTEATCPNHPIDKKDQKDCCSSEFNLIKTEFNHDLYQPQLKAFDFNDVLPIMVFVFLKHQMIDLDHQKVFIANWDPPSYSAVSLTSIQRFLC